jgi:hypothetical protein
MSVIQWSGCGGHRCSFKRMDWRLKDDAAAILVGAGEVGAGAGAGRRRGRIKIGAGLLFTLYRKLFRRGGGFAIRVP